MSATNTATAADWLEGARPHTWANAIAPVLAGTAAAVTTGGASFPRALLALVVALALIIGVNYANDYSDGIRGTDDDRSGPLRLTGSGLVEPTLVKYAAFACFGVAGVAGIALSLLSTWWLILVGAVCIAGAWFYTGGENPYGYRGLGEVAVFIFFGLVAVLGTEFTQSGQITWRGLGLAVTIGALSSSVNLANNLRDIPTDSVTGKITLAVRLGDAGTRALWLSLVGGSVVLTIALALGQLAALLGLLAVPLWVLASGPVRKGAQGKDLIPVLGLTGRGMLLWSVMMLNAAFI
ncbi:1,4-dihydroxy-2-naphthoate polyprenyltransferase [Corynebacterium urealyticum]|uniref:1,4-dihydroxy-2-naphthoate octaprenyltransferase n=1 Tax=Corynebacterium urealyticum (strain ATCC 43042 / DSM 7109) TaxID=504474 RepID=B1VEL6_CORU7|nr:1,4-dihydroxy-2-naphthoate polyprenyltransferase [Corynebacterium urealyticum]QQC42266.1 1,4-dihydroxy-2-naphthoate polyprenyltransferase [Corynebacterium urealyticum]CAQ04205.1 1,4-dihydroxy-2-naphthoate octaprenyltransferase [Corynebacterium urealyticum DSM 7109]SNV94048.1 1,4-dihydroxy-2-naphthoate octaprenyltransferase [Corynebacterium urealyticum]